MHCNHWAWQPEPLKPTQSLCITTREVTAMRSLGTTARGQPPPATAKQSPPSKEDPRQPKIVNKSLKPHREPGKGPVLSEYQEMSAWFCPVCGQSITIQRGQVMQSDHTLKGIGGHTHLVYQKDPPNPLTYRVYR